METLGLYFEIHSNKMIVHTNHELGYKLPLWLSLNSSHCSYDDIKWEKHYPNLEEIRLKIVEIAKEMMAFFFKYEEWSL